ncbi:MAG TPA: hypothetical protein VFK02_28035 [Kofleriaceae bacterium]|nr:hypothetical protein [Kofleriaceae bacterium]
MQSLIVGDLRIEATETTVGPAVQLLWRGKSNHRHPGEVLAPYFREMLAIAKVRNLPLELHFEKLEHFNSSTITSLIQLIQDARTRAVKLILIYDQALKWQKLSFDALRVFARDDLLELRAA